MEKNIFGDLSVLRFKKILTLQCFLLSLQEKNKPNWATMRIHCFSMCIDFEIYGGKDGWTDRYIDMISKEALKTFPDNF